MPNWCDNRLTILAPSAHMDALLAALSGRNDWSMPIIQTDWLQPRLGPMSAHEQMAIGKRLSENGEDLRAAYRHAHPGHPDWMPVARDEIERWVRLGAKDDTPILDKPEVPVSFARLLPMDEDMFHACFPGELDAHGFWRPEPQAERAYNSGSCGPIALRNHLIGVKWPPNRMKRVKDATLSSHPQPWAVAAFDWMTPYGPVASLDEALRPALTEHGAKAMLVWMEEDAHSGWFGIDPARDAQWEEHTRAAFQTAEDVDGEAGWVWDRKSLAQVSLNAWNDPDFIALGERVLPR